MGRSERNETGYNRVIEDPKAGDPPRARQSLLEALRHPLVDRLVAVLVCLPFIVVVVYRIRSGIFDLPRIAIIAEMLLQILPMVLRRSALRISASPGYWLLAVAGTYWPFAMALFGGAGRPILPPAATNLLSVLSLLGAAYARLSLGRNVSIVPAQRQLVRRGAYRYVRHPIYTTVLLAYLSFVLSAFTITNVLMVIVGALLLALRSLGEERFLSSDPDYRAYLKDVRWRWIPGIA